MTSSKISPSGTHDHVFGQDRKRPGENRTILVIAITIVMMAVEIAAGILFGSIALLADGLHMASHAVALGLSVFAYIYARRHARDSRFSFGTGKVNSLGGFTGALVLGMFSLLMAYESVERLLDPVTIAFNQAIAVAVAGLIVNAVSFVILNVNGDGGDDAQSPHRHDHNLKAACFHVLADALTSVLAIVALLSARFYGLLWMDPLMGIAGAILIFRWSWGLLKITSRILLDRQADDALRLAICDALEQEGDAAVTDFHLWAIGPGLYSAVISITVSDPKPPEVYKSSLPRDAGLAHVTLEINPG